MKDTKQPVKTVKDNWYHSKTAGHEIHGQSVIYSDSGKTIAIVYDGEEHAKLLAAAPELLDACRELLKYGSFNRNGAQANQAAESALKAIAKATE